jgi:hypothetical protein
MSSIIFGYTMSLTTAATPSTGFLVAYDADGILKQKDSEGVITAITGVSSGVGSLSQVLATSNDSGAYTILMGTGTSLSSQNGLSSFYLDYSSLTSSVYLTNGYNYLSISNATMSLVSVLSSTINISNSSNYLKLTSTYSEISSTSEVRLRVFNSSDEILLKSNVGTSVTSADSTSNAVFIGSQNSSFNSNITNSVIIGGVGQSAVSSNSVYIPDTYIQDGKKIRGSLGNANLSFTNTNNLILQNGNTLLALISSTSSTSLTTNGVIVSDTNSGVYSPDIDSYATFISVKNGYIESGVRNAIIIGGVNLINSMTNSVVLGEYVNINNAYTLPTVDGSSGEVMVTDGSGNLTWQSTSNSNQSLEDVLSISNDSGVYSIQMGTGTSIHSSRGGGQIDLDYTLDSVAISTDSGFLNKAFIQLDYDDVIIEASGNLNIGANTASIVVNNGEGLVYGFDYSSSFVTYSLVDKNYVDSLLSTPGNGLDYISSGVIGLGGTLSNSASINGLDLYDLNFTSMNRILMTASTYIDNSVTDGYYYSQQYLDNTNAYLISTDVVVGTYSRFVVNYNQGLIESSDGVSMVSIGLNNIDQIIGDGSTNNRIIIDDSAYNKGIVYNDDYTSNFTTYSLVTKGYVDSQVVSSISKYSTTLSFSASVSQIITHSLGTDEVIVQTYDSSGVMIIGDVSITDINSVSIRFSQTLSNVKTVIIG